MWARRVAVLVTCGLWSCQDAVARKPRWDKAWTEVATEALQREGFLADDFDLPVADRPRACPEWSSLTADERRDFWLATLQAMAKLESNHDPQACYREKAFKASRANNDAIAARYDPKKTKKSRAQWLTTCHEPRLQGDVYSEGLFQLSYGDERRYPTCEIDPETKNIRDPAVNIRCAVHILGHQLKKKKTLFPSKYFYWSVLTRESSLKKLTTLLKRTRPATCG